MNLKIYPDKEKKNTPILQLNDGYIGFDLWTIISGKREIKKIKLSDGFIDLIQDAAGEINLVKAFSSERAYKENQNSKEDLHINLKQIEFKNIQVSKINESSGIKIVANIPRAQSKFKSSSEHMLIQPKAKLELTIIKDGDTTFIKNKHIELKTQADYLTQTQLLTFEQTVVKLKGSEFNMEDSIDLDNDMLLDQYFNGKKPNFDFFISMSPEKYHSGVKELLKQRENIL